MKKMSYGTIKNPLRVRGFCITLQGRGTTFPLRGSVWGQGAAQGPRVGGVMALGPARNGDETAQVDVMVLCSPEMLEELDSLIALAEAQIAHLCRLRVGPAM